MQLRFLGGTPYPAIHRAMQEAYRRAGVAPADVNVAEVHDCFTVMAAIGAEVLGKAEIGQGARYWAEGHASVGGACPINTSGGLIAKGHPIGATGVAMVGWSAWQLTGSLRLDWLDMELRNDFTRQNRRLDLNEIAFIKELAQLA